MDTLLQGIRKFINALLRRIIFVSFISIVTLGDLVGQLREDCQFSKNNEIYKVGREFKYELITDVDPKDFVHSTPLDSLEFTGNFALRLKVDSNCFYEQTQIEYSYYFQDSLINIEWTGVIENSKQVWMHPPRSLIKEVSYSPFLYYRFGEKKWKQNFILAGNKDQYLSEKKFVFIKCRYEVNENDSNVEFNGQLISCKVLDITSKFNRNRYHSRMLFNDKYGFIHVDVTFMNQHSYSLRLLDCIEPRIIRN